MFSSSFFLLFGLSTTTADQKCLSPVNLSSIKSPIAEALQRASKDFLLSFLATTPPSKRRCSTDVNGRFSMISSMAASPRPLMVVRGAMRVVSSCGVQRLPEVLIFRGLIVYPQDLAMLIAASLRDSGSLSKKAQAHSAL